MKTQTTIRVEETYHNAKEILDISGLNYSQAISIDELFRGKYIK